MRFQKIERSRRARALHGTERENRGEKRKGLAKTPSHVAERIEAAIENIDRVIGGKS